MTTEELEALSAVMAGVIKEQVDAATQPLLERIATLEARAPKDGVGVAGALIDRSGNLVLTLSNGSTCDLGQVVGKDGDAGSPGKDGFGLEDFDAEVMDDGRTVLLSFERGDLSYKVELGFPVMLYRGVFSPEREYERGDTVTWAGSLWHCEADKTAEKPGDGSKSWTLAAKRGRDGRDTPVKAIPEKPVVKVA